MNSDQKSRIIYNNLVYFGVDLDSIYRKSAKKFVEIIISKYLKKNKIGIVAGLGGNGLDGLYIAEELFKNGKEVEVFIPDRVNHSDNDLFKEKFKELSQTVSIKQDIYAKDVVQPELLIEALIGTGFSGEKVYKRTADILKRVSHFNCPIIAIDKPIQGYSPDLTISINYPKTTKAIAIENVYPESLINSIGPGELLEIHKPYSKSHKSKSGKLLYISFERETAEERKLSAFAKQYSTILTTISIKSLFTDYSKESYKEKLVGVDTVVIGSFSESDNLTANIIYTLLEELPDTKVINLNSEIKFHENLIEVFESPRSIGNSSAFAKFVKSYNSYFLFEDGEKKLDTEGILVTKDSIENLILLASIFSSSNEIKLSILAAAFVIIHFRKNKLNLEKDITNFFEEVF